MGVDTAGVTFRSGSPARRAGVDVVQRAGAVVEMMTRTGILVLLVTLSTGTLCGASPPAQEPAPAAREKASPRVTLPQSVGPAGGAVAVPVRLAGADSVEIGVLTVTLRFPAARLTFTKAEVGGLGAAVDARATARTERRGEDTLLEVTIATPATSGARTPLPDGPIAQLMFTVAKDLKPETVIALNVEAAGLDTVEGAAPVTIAASDSEIIVSNPSVISCFFYMH